MDRSSSENSARLNNEAEDSTGTAGSSGGLGRGSDIVVSPRRHWLGTPAEDERAAVALDHTPVNLGPEGNEVVNRRNQRDTHHEPDGEIGDPVNRENVIIV